MSVLVFWSRYSAESDEVEREYTKGIHSGLRVIPVLLNETPLPPALSSHQWVDLRVSERDPTGYWRYVGIHPGMCERITLTIVQALDRQLAAET